MNCTREEIRISNERTFRRELPDIVIAPSCWHRTRVVIVICQMQKMITELCCTYALSPPVIGGVDHRVSTSETAIGFHEITNPSSEIGAAHVVAGVAKTWIWVIFNVEQTRHRDSVVSPPTAVSDEIACLLSTRSRTRVSEMIGATNHARLCGTVVLLSKVRVSVIVTLCCFCVCKTGPHIICTVPVYISLV